MIGSSVILVVLLALMEVSFSFDNAVVNATVLQKLSPKVQRAFLSWGILFSVFLVRLLLPACIVAVSAKISLPEVFHLATTATGRRQYAHYVTAAHDTIAVFGGTFLILIFLSFLLDAERKEYWIDWLERNVALVLFIDVPTAGKYIIMLCVAAIVNMAFTINYVPMVAGMCLFLLMEVAENFISSETATVMKGLTGFLYLELLDASFSFDGVIGAFSMSSDIVVIMVGLGIGSFVIRWLTLYMVRKQTLEAFRYLEHGAHYSIGALGFLMLLGTTITIPAVVTGLIGITFIGLAMISSEVAAHARS